MDYSEIEDFDINSRLKWTGMLSRFRRTPGRFMMRLRIPNGIVKADTLRLFADTIEPYGDELGVMDITTRQNIQLRGLTLEDGADLTKALHADHNMTSFQSALDNARNVVGSPLAGLDDKELRERRPQRLRVKRRDRIIPTLHDLSREAFHRLGLEWCDARQVELSLRRVGRRFCL